MQNDLLKIIQKVKDGDTRAFKKLVEKFQQQAFSLAFRMLSDEEEARDVVQECFISMWQKIHTYNNDQKFTSWMYKIISNRSIDIIRTRKRHPLLSLERLLPELMSNEETGVDQVLENKDIARLIRGLTDELPEKQRMVFILRDLHGVSSREVAEITNMPESIIKSNLYHARQKIREKLVIATNYERR